ncbi:MAG: ACP S-malonyltransferase [Xanthomonadales bacterium]|nr:ACP S-malonyltransferase [Gammaproteobacteria bacterium]NNL96097.1 ACP S-malonyltransferase [Xanthomonadales bacterium]
MSDNNKTAFLFPGQGSQSLGMMAELAEFSPLVRKVFDQASQALGFDLWGMCQQGPETALNQTENTQPAMLAAGFATWRVWLDSGGQAPAVMAGHSLGEYTALVAAGALSFDDAIRTVALRGRLMQIAAPEGVGAMAAVLGMDDADLAAICEQAAGDEIVSCANFNAPGQVVIAGHRSAVERACEAAKSAGARRALLLPVSVPSHCLLMKPAAEELAVHLQELEISSPSPGVLHNADVAAYEQPDEIRDALARQLWQPVRWTETIRQLTAQGISRFIECGPGRVLAGLNRRIDRAAEIHALTDGAAFVAAMGETET